MDIHMQLDWGDKLIWMNLNQWISKEKENVIAKVSRNEQRLEWRAEISSKLKEQKRNAEQSEKKNIKETKKCNKNVGATEETRDFHYRSNFWGRFNGIFELILFDNERQNLSSSPSVTHQTCCQLHIHFVSPTNSAVLGATKMATTGNAHTIPDYIQVQ